MTDQPQSKMGKIPLKDFLNDFRSTVTDAELKEKYQLSTRNLVSLIKALLEKGLVTAEDLAWRKNMAVQRDLAKQSEFLSGLYICPHCSHPHPKPFRVCPACGADTGDAFADQEMLQSIFSTEVREAISDAEDEEPPPVDETQLLDVSELPGSQAREHGQETVNKRNPKPKEPPKNKPSARNTVRSLISKLKKK